MCPDDRVRTDHRNVSGEPLFIAVGFVLGLFNRWATLCEDPNGPHRVREHLKFSVPGLWYRFGPLDNPY